MARSQFMMEGQRWFSLSRGGRNKYIGAKLRKLGAVLAPRELGYPMLAYGRTGKGYLCHDNLIIDAS